MLTDHEASKVKKLLDGKDEGLSVIFGALSDPKRCRIFRSFLKERQLCVSDIVKILGISMPSASQHLKVLETRNLLVRERKGRRIYYVLNDRHHIVKAIVKTLG